MKSFSKGWLELMKLASVDELRDIGAPESGVRTKATAAQPARARIHRGCSATVPSNMLEIDFFFAFSFNPCYLEDLQELDKRV